jgi:hypothetical protein
MSQVDDSAMFNRNLSVGNVGALIGRSEGGPPNTAMRFGSAAQARAVLRTGELLKAIEKAFDPSSETAGPTEIVAIRVNPATQSALTLKGGSAVDSIGLVSTDYGRYTRGIQIKIEDASERGKRVTTQFGNTYYSADNLYRDAFLIAYGGEEDDATIAISATTLTLCAPALTPVAAITLSDAPTIQQVADLINQVAGFTCTVLDGNGQKPSYHGLDLLATTTIDPDDGLVVRGDVQAVIDWINGQAEGFVTATRLSGAGGVLTNIPLTNLANGSDGSVTNTEWQSAFSTLQAEDVQWLAPISPTPAIHAMADAHCAYMSNVGRMERRAFVGPDIGTSDTDALAAAKALNSDRTALTHLGFYDYDENGDLQLYPPYIMAALFVGAFSGVNPGTAITNKAIKVRGIERKLRNPTDTDRLISGGVMCVEDTRTRGFRCVRSVSTWLTNTNYNRVEVSTGAAADFVSRNVREELQAFVGAKGAPVTLTAAIERVKSKLDELARPEPMGPAIIVGDAVNPAYKNIEASIEGDVMRVEFQCSPVIPINYVPVVIHAVPWSGRVIAPST